MSRYRYWIQLINPIIFILILISLAQAENSKKEVLPAVSMSGIIAGTFEHGKLLLSSNDKIVIDLNTPYGIKPGDQIVIAGNEKLKDGIEIRLPATEKPKPKEGNEKGEPGR